MIADFNLNKDDSMVFYIMGNNEIKIWDKIKIDSVENASIFGVPSKILYLRFNGNKNFNFAEHFGCLRSGIPYWRNLYTKSSVRCIGMCYQDSTISWMENIDSDPGYLIKDLGCEKLQNSLILGEFGSKKTINIFPNPSDRMVTIESDYQIQKVCIFSSLGIIQKTITFNTKTTIWMSVLYNQGFIF